MEYVRWQKTFKISKIWHLASPPSAFTRIQNIGNKMEKAIDKTYEWVVWW
jgi:hypothetical protein